MVERLGHVRWPDYALTQGPSLFPSRERLLAWEWVLAGLEAATPLPSDEAELKCWMAAAQGPGQLDLRDAVRRTGCTQARTLERLGEVDSACALYRSLRQAGVPASVLAFRWSRAEEAAGRPGVALGLLKDARRSARGAAALEISRAGRRVARSLRRSWAPNRPLRQAPERYLRLEQAASSGPRPRWVAKQDRAEVVELAVCQRLADIGRRAIHGEGRLWRTLFALIFAEAYFLPIPGALPVPCLAGPLDLGTSRFRHARQSTCEHILSAVRAGRAPYLVRSAHSRWSGTRLAWARWDVASLNDLIAVTEGLEGPGLATILEHLLDEGRIAARGLPDLVILPGQSADASDIVPRRISEHLLLAEIKGPGDSIRDVQAVWIHRLLEAGVPVEVWNVAPALTNRVNGPHEHAV